MMSGRGLGHTGGTLDKLESIPGFRTNLSIAEMRASLAAIGCALIGQTAQIAPADKKLYALRDVTGTIESVPLISASIMSKKIAEGIGALVLDVKSGKGAFMKTPAEARALAESLVAIGKCSRRPDAGGHHGDELADRVCGRQRERSRRVHRAAERKRPCRTSSRTRSSSASGCSSSRASRRIGPRPRRMCRRALDSGEALERLRAIIERQGGDPRVIDDYSRMPQAPEEHVLRAETDGFVTELDAGLIGRAVGGARRRARQSR